MQKSEILKNDEYVKLDGTDGLTMNIFVSYQKQIDLNKSFSLTGGFPVIDRDYRPDGLTRTFTITAQLSWNLGMTAKKSQPKDNLYDLFDPLKEN